MKTNIKTYLLASIFLVAITYSGMAQTRKRTNTKTVTTKTVTKRTPNRVSSTKVVYKTPKKKVVSVRSVPNRTIVKHNGRNYYYANNKFYTASRGRYIVIAPKIGFRIRTLPVNYRRVHFNNHIYYNVAGTFYSQVGSDYEVVEPEIGTIVYELPDNYEKVIIDGQTYYEFANILYEKIQVDGTRAYEVVGIIDME
ncbi:hypothetical protein GH721_02760 [Kriegella sp. EG-1]|nr:hypothetical protein [Flavobacteriaceae bacterium EG-1]